jgi:hypothetical protein
MERRFLRKVGLTVAKRIKTVPPALSSALRGGIVEGESHRALSSLIAGEIHIAASVIMQLFKETP